MGGATSFPSDGVSLISNSLALGTTIAKLKDEKQSISKISWTFRPSAAVDGNPNRSVEVVFLITRGTDEHKQKRLRLFLKLGVPLVLPGAAAAANNTFSAQLSLWTESQDGKGIKGRLDSICTNWVGFRVSNRHREDFRQCFTSEIEMILQEMPLVWAPPVEADSEFGLWD